MEATGVNYNVPAIVERYRGRALLVGAVFLILGAALAFLFGGIVHVFRTYLVGFFFITGVAVGSLAWLALGHMTGGAWVLTSRRLFEAATRTIPLCAVFFLPVVVALFVHDPGQGHYGHTLYEWADTSNYLRDGKVIDEALYHKSKYLNVTFFIIRAVIYFGMWWIFATLLNRWSAEQDASGDPRIRRKMQDISGPVLLLFGLTVTFAAVDWGMSLEPHWFSTIYGLIAMAGWGLSALAFMITVATFLKRHEPMADAYQPLHFHDWGKLLLAMVMLYAYFSFSEFLIIWAGNLPEEIPYYIRRLQGGWKYVGLLIILFHFMLPFVLLLSRGRKRVPRSLNRIALLMLFMRVFDLVFLFAPSVHQGASGEFGARDLWQSFVPMFAMTLGLGGIWLWHYLGQLSTRPLLPLGAPDLDKALEAAEHH